MPPEQPLPENVISDFTQWISRGAADPRKEPSSSDPAPSGDHGSFWAFRPPAQKPVPIVNDNTWSQNPIDQFILARHESESVTAAGDADPRVLVRRLYLDLTGLPPSFDDIQSFATAWHRDRQHATADLVDHLLALPQFGERWGRHWLDVARFGESNGNDGLGRNPTFPHALAIP